VSMMFKVSALFLHAAEAENLRFKAVLAKAAAEADTAKAEAAAAAAKDRQYELRGELDEALALFGTSRRQLAAANQQLEVYTPHTCLQSHMSLSVSWPHLHNGGMLSQRLW